MAEISVSLNTDDESFEVLVNGQVISDVDTLNICNSTDWDGERKLTFYLSKYKKVDGVRISQTICASTEYRKGKEIVTDPDLEVKGKMMNSPNPVDAVVETDLASAIAEFFTRD